MPVLLRALQPFYQSGFSFEPAYGRDTVLLGAVMMILVFTEPIHEGRKNGGGH